VAGAMWYVQQQREICSETFRADKEMTLVFFTHPASYYVRLKKAERRDNHITVYYEFEPHASPEVTVHFALIPLGVLPAGEYHVRFKQIPMSRKYRDAGFEPVPPEAFYIVCRPFTFTMWEPADPAPAKDASLIPLDQVWAYGMPGTRDVRELEPKADPNLSIEELYRRLDVWKILKVLNRRPKEGEKAGPGFTVAGTGKEALENAEDVFTSGKEAPRVFPPDAELTLVFYSHMCGRYVRVVSVEQSPESITVKYQLISHMTAEMTTHFALIPLGTLPEGMYQVKIEQLEPVDERGRPVSPIRDPQQLVCDSFSFTVQRE